MALTLAFEASAFIVITYIVGRPRTGVESLIESPVDTSYPSGHVAAATVYLAFAVIVFWHTRSPVARVATTVVICATIAAVGLSRMYQVCTT